MPPGFVPDASADIGATFADAGPEDAAPTDAEVQPDGAALADVEAADAELADVETTDASLADTAIADVSPLDTGIMDGGARIPDLTVAWVNQPTQLEPGANLLLELRVVNAGDAPCPPTELLVDLRASGAPVGMARTLSRIGVRSLTAGEAEPLTLSVLVPVDIGVGPQILRLWVDPGTFVPESDESNNALEVTLTVPGLTVTPAALTFAGAVVGCAAMTQTLTVNNPRAAATQLLTATVIGGPELSLVPVALPAQIGPGGSLNLTVRYLPNAAGNHSARLDLGAQQTNMFTVSVPLSGSAMAPVPRTESFNAVGGGQVDILFVVDNSCSMAEEQASLAAQAAAFFGFLQNSGLDWQIGVTTTDTDPTGAMGRLVSGPNNQVNGTPRIITPQTANGGALFASFVNQGTNGSANEKGLDAAFLALNAPLVTGHNAGFLRPSAGLVIIILSDEEDYSAPPVSSYPTFFQGLKPAGQVKMNAIVGPAPAGCNGAGGTADHGSRYLSVVASLMGQAVSICSVDWSGAWTNLSGLGGRSVTLAADPQPGTITVRVDGNLVPEGMAGGTTGWSRSGRQIIFGSTSVPPAGAVVQVTYTPAC